MNFTECLANLDETLKPDLGVAGFRRARAGLWRRRRGQEINVVWIQKHSSASSCCVNFGVHYTFLPKVGAEEAITCDELEQTDCEIQFRLTADSSLKDQWWLFSKEAADAISRLVVGRGLVLFEAYKLDGGINEVTTQEIESGAQGLLSTLTKVRACLLLARLHEHCGDRIRCLEAAALGLKLAGMAVGPKKMLKDILKRCERAV